MGLFGFGKKKTSSSTDNLQSTTGLDKSLGDDSGLGLDALNTPGANPEQKYDSFGNPLSENKYNPMSSPLSPSQVPKNEGGDSKDMQIIIAKLDAIKAEVNNISHRLDIIESKEKQPQASQRRYPW